jgi:hypothetical protein
VCFDVICLLALSVALGDSAREVAGVGEYRGLGRAGAHHAVMDSLSDGRRAGILALDKVLAGGLLICPQDMLRHGTLQGIRHGGDAVTVYGQDYEVVLLLGLLWDRQAEDLVDVLACYSKLDLAGSIDSADAAVGCID